MAVSVGDFVRITAKMKILGTDDMQNVYTFRVDRNDTVDDAGFMVAMALHMDDAYTLINVNISDQITYVSVDGQNISKDELLPDTPWPVLTAGTNVNNMLPQQVAGCVFWPTITPKVRTSTFLGGFVTALVNATGGIGASTLANMALFGAAMRLVSTANVDAVKGSFNPVALLFTPSGVAQVPTRWRTQRRRRIGVGS